ncbi:MAG: hypothetical protein P4M15_01790 [Alphaproteobacteria bacterium]|nr:hypothetical protein [Alphaproteobacteria bacterium]
MRKFLAIVLGALLVAAAARAENQKIIQQEDIVELAGHICVEKHYGSPGYGKTPQKDEVVRVPMLILDAPVDVLASMRVKGSHAFANVKKVQIIGMRKLIISMNGQPIALTGTLSEKSIPEDYTDILIKADSLVPR